MSFYAPSTAVAVSAVRRPVRRVEARAARTHANLHLATVSITHRLTLLVVGLSAASLAPALPASAQAVPTAAAASSDSARVAATVRAVFAAVERGDLAALDTLYAGDSLTVVEGAGMNRTWAEYRDHHLGPELKEMRAMRYRPADIEVRTAGDFAWAVFRYALSAELGARKVDVVGRGTAVVARRGARWVVRHTHTSGRPRRASDPKAGED